MKLELLQAHSLKVIWCIYIELRLRSLPKNTDWTTNEKILLPPYVPDNVRENEYDNGDDDHSVIRVDVVFSFVFWYGNIW